MHHIYLLALAVILTNFSPAYAAEEGVVESLVPAVIVNVEDADNTEEEEQADIAPLPDKASSADERLELSKQMHEIWPIRPKVERALDAISSQIDAPNRLKFKSTMRKAIDFDELQQGSIDAMADIYTVKELEAMIAFYGSKEGQSVSYKTDDYEKALQPIMTKMVDKALLDLKTGVQAE